MNEQEKRNFITQVMENIKNHILANVSKMPESWDGHELRRYIADEAEEYVIGTKMGDKRTARYRAYLNSIQIYNL